MESNLTLFLVFACSVLLHILASSDATGSRVNRNLDNLFSYGRDPYTSYKGAGGEYSIFPPGPTGKREYFSDKMDFTTFQDHLLIGAADQLYLLDMDLKPTQNGVLFWNSTRNNFEACSRDQDYEDNVDYYCRNHIRLYSRFPEDPDLLFVCGTQSVSTAQCRAVNVSGDSFVEAYEASEMGERIISVNPDYPSYGLFRDRPGDNTSFVSWFFYEQRQSVNYVYQFDLQTIQYNAETRTLNNTVKFGKNNNWVSEPMYIVDFIALSYELSGASSTTNYDYYYAFIRERNAYSLDYTTSAEQGSISYVLRVCQDDPGTNYTDGTPPSFGTALKARLYCDFEGPNTGNNPLAARDMRYNDIWSVTFSKTGVDGRIGSERILMYAAFSGPLTGPPGAGICTFSAEASAIMGNDRNNGLFDTFREDIIVGSTTNYMPMDHQFYDCDGRSRPAEGSGITSQTVLVSERILQLSGNPLLILDGYYITSMTTDVTCVVMRSDRSRCQVLDVLFVGTSNGTVLKVWGGDQLPKVVAEEIALEPDIYVRDLRVKEINGSKFIYVSTLPRLYKLSMGRCSRHKTLRDCVGSRDPYCVWNATNTTCELTQLDSSTSVPPYILQNIFDGSIPNLVNVSLTTEQTMVVEGDSIDVDITASGTVPNGLLSVHLYKSNSSVGVPYNVTGLSGSSSVTVTIMIPDDLQFAGTQELSLCLQSGNFGAVEFTTRCVTLTCIDNDGSWVSLAQSQFEVVEGNILNVMIMANRTVPDGTITLSLYQRSTRVIGINVSGLSSSGVAVPVAFSDDKEFLGRQEYSIELQASTSAGIVFDIQNASVLPIDSDGFFAQVGLKNLDDVCVQWKVTDIDTKLKFLDDAIMTALKGGFTIARNGVYCPSNVNQLYVAVYRFNITTMNNNAPELANALKLWVSKEEKISPFSFTVDASCVTRIQSLDDSLCGPLLVGALNRINPETSGEVVGLGVIVALLLFFNLFIVLPCVILYCSNKKYKWTRKFERFEGSQEEELNNVTSSHGTMPSSPEKKHVEDQGSSEKSYPQKFNELNRHEHNGVNYNVEDSLSQKISDKDGEKTAVTPFYENFGKPLKSSNGDIEQNSTGNASSTEKPSATQL